MDNPTLIQQKIQSKESLRSWIVCISVFLSYGIVWGTMGSIPILYVALYTVFNQTNFLNRKMNDPTSTNTGNNEESNLLSFQLSLIISINLIVSYLSSPIVPPLIKLIGVRIVASFGVILSVIGAIICAIAQNQSIWPWWLGFGFLIGLGSPLIYVPSMLAIEWHFDQHYGILIFPLIINK